ncbi:hypothetical protein JCM12856_11850 [Spirochaeta dissipatitropha]
MNAIMKKNNNSTIRFLTAAMILLLFPVILPAENQRVIYSEGDPELRRGSRSEFIFPGTELQGGDSIYTGIYDLVDLEQGAGNTIRVHPDTVFTVREIAVEGRTERQLTASRGAVGFSFSQPGGSRRVGTATTAAGVRGTEFTMFAGTDGSAFYLVEKGEVEVASMGQSVTLLANQAVQVAPNEPPGEVISWVGRTLDFSDWNGERLDAFLQDPQGSLYGLTDQLARFATSMERTYMSYRESSEQLEAARTYMYELQKEDVDAFREYRDEIVFPLMVNTGNLYLNTRYYALSALSMRRHVAGSLYVHAKARALLDPDSEWADYLEDHAYFVQFFESRIVPRLQDGDI